MRHVVFALQLGAIVLTSASYAQTGSAQYSDTSAERRQADAAPTRRIVIFALTEKKLIGADGTILGDIDRVVVGRAEKHYVLVSRGGFLGYLQTQYAIPLNEVVAEGDRIKAKSLTEAQLENGTPFDEKDAAYSPLPFSQTVNVAEQR